MQNASGQKNALSCADLHEGIFYVYPKNLDNPYIDIREGDMQRERNIKTGDSSLWQIKWLNECTYTLKYISGNEPLPAGSEKLLKKHKLVFQITEKTTDYYLYTAYFDKTSNLPIQQDTMWFQEKLKPVNNNLFTRISKTSAEVIDFKDTTSYALLYVYRPKKITNSLGNFMVYFDENMMCVGKNNTGYVFKVLKEGAFTIKSRVYRDVAATTVNISFGKVYYIKSFVNWTITSRLYNFSLGMVQMPTVEGKEDFEQVRSE